MKQMLTLPRSEALELLDHPISDRRALADNLRDLRTSDLLIGATRLIWNELRPLLAEHPPARIMTLLDVATGRADGPQILTSMARAAGYTLQPYASDLLIEALTLAHDQAQINGVALNLICHDARHIPIGDGALDVVTCALALHHFAPLAAAELIHELARVADRAAIIVDLQRTWAGYLGARLMASGPWSAMARHDGPLSVLRAYTPAELEAIIRSAGVRAVVRRAGPLLVSIIVQGATVR